MLASLPLFQASRFFLNTEMSLADCAMVPIIWRLPALGIKLPKEARAIEDYGHRFFHGAGFMRSMTEEERLLGDLSA